MNLEPSIWGPYYWNTFHFMAASYDNNPNQSVKAAMKTFLQSIPLFLPCKECQDNALVFIKSKDLDVAVSSRKELFEFFFEFHNRVNYRLKKPLMTIEDALKKYHVIPLVSGTIPDQRSGMLPTSSKLGTIPDQRSNGGESEWFSQSWVVVVIAIGILILVLFWKKKLRL